MTLSEYELRSKATDRYPRVRIIIDDREPIEAPWLCALLGLVGEAGELAEKFKKAIRDDQGVLTPARATAAELELGDVLWYVPRVAEALGTSLEEIAEINLMKLESRKERNALGGEGDER